MERISGGGWHLTDKEIAGNMKLKDVSLSNIGEGDKNAQMALRGYYVCPVCGGYYLVPPQCS